MGILQMRVCVICPFFCGKPQFSRKSPWFSRKSPWFSGKSP
ncbi:hypothetical protein ROSINTL182_08227 [Roseburia intestinalis L1-82]|uniref:Uncharacterized protein n=1 Tax=Roseburia intestinalis L1-82 TaxID=536231 RepID=C7GE75_9FIRM|nr:hypothetical protein ROSINTL182_08227 [Roseburia intestinalis L1-82]